MIAAEYNGITFTAVELPRKMGGDAQCAKCVFADARSHDCIAASKAAMAVTLPDCDMPSLRGLPVIYVRFANGDVRQGDLAGPAA